MVSVSVLMPVFNVQEFIQDALDSVLKQTFSDFELVIVDDASTDDTVKIIEKYKAIDSRIILVENRKNVGISKALNNGLAVCSGKYIARIDGDDLMDPERLARQYQFLEDNPDHALVGCWVKNIDVNGALIGECRYPCVHSEIISAVKWTSPVLHIWMARKSVYNLFGGYRDTNPAEDYDFLLRCISRGFQVANLPFFGAYIRLRHGNTMSFAALKQRKAFNYLYRLYLSGGINDSNNLCLDGKSEIEISPAASRIHQLSTYFLRRGFERRNSITSYFYFMLSLISPYTIQDIYRRVMFKCAIKKKEM